MERWMSLKKMLPLELGSSWFHKDDLWLEVQKEFDVVVRREAHLEMVSKFVRLLFFNELNAVFQP